MEQEFEIWKPVVGYEDLYEISNLGRVKSLERIVNDNGGEKRLKEQILKPSYVGGYYKIRLYINRKHKDYSIHRLVAQAFIPNPDNLPIINHKDENKLNNTVENLEWCTIKYNNTYGTVIEKQRRSHINHPISSKPVICIELNIIFPSTREAERIIGVNHWNISECCNGIKYHSTAGGYHWQYIND